MAQWTFLSPNVFYFLQATALWTLHSTGNGAMNSSAISAKVQWTPPWYWQQCNELLCDDACSYVETIGKYTGGCTMRMGKISSAFEKAERKNAAYPYGAMNVHSRIGKLFPNSQQLYDMVL
jgi:hypothetical protein